MSIRDAGAVLKETRTMKRYTQEQLSDGICTVLSLSRIENRKAGISPSTFKKLMERMGVNRNHTPCFSSKNEFEVFRKMHTLFLYIDSWQIENAIALLDEIKDLNYADNILYFQECQLANATILLKNNFKNYEKIYTLIQDALNLTFKNFSIEIFEFHLCSITELRLLIILPEILIHLRRDEDALKLLKLVDSYLNNTNITYNEKMQLLTMNAVVMSHVHIMKNNYSFAFKIAEEFRDLCLQSHEYKFLIELTFLSAIGKYHLGEKEEACHIFKVCYYSSYGMNNIFSNVIKQYIYDVLHLQKELDFMDKENLPLPSSHYTESSSTPAQYGITKSIETETLYQIGDLIRDLREEYKLSQSELCHGLCSKSKLSKIENNTLTPKKYLIDVLLQRLGGCSEMLLLYGNTKDFEISEAKNIFILSIINQEYKTAETVLYYLEKINYDKMDKQFISMGKAMLTFDYKNRIFLFQKSLELTLSNFKIADICSFNLSYTELTILNNIAICYAQIGQNLTSINFLYKIMEYFTSHKIDVQEKSKTFGVTLLNLSSKLYEAKRFEELEELYKQTTFYIDINNFSGFLFNYCLSLFENKNNKIGAYYANCVCALKELLNLKSHSVLLQKKILNDFNWKIDF